MTYTTLHAPIDSISAFNHDVTGQFQNFAPASYVYVFFFRYLYQFHIIMQWRRRRVRCRMEVSGLHLHKLLHQIQLVWKGKGSSITPAERTTNSI